MGTMKKGFVSLVAGILMCLMVMPVFAEQDLQQQMTEKQNQAAVAQQQVDSVTGTLQKTQMELDTAQNEYQLVENQLKATQEQIAANKVILANAEKTLSVRTKVLNVRMRDVYKNGQISYIDVLFGASDFGDFTTRLDLLQRVVKQDIDLVAEVKAERQLIVDKKGELERDEAAITPLKKAAQQKKQILESKKAAQQATLNAAVNQRDMALRAYQELLATSQQIEQMIRSGNRGIGGGGGSGVFIWPVSGPITSPFGWRDHPVLGDVRFHSGIDIGAGYGETVVAADTGVVTYAGWMDGYGKTIMIDHGGGIVTLYGHSSELLVSEGQRVAKGQAIMLVGMTGYATGPHCHFEVRQNGSPVSPMSYLP